MKRAAISLLVAVWVVSACGPWATAVPAGGIEGQVFIGPVCPVERLGAPCPDQPFQATIDVLNASGRRAARFQTDAQGRFRIALSPGTYTLVPESPGGITRAGEQTVVVAGGQYTRVTITYDSGIR